MYGNILDNNRKNLVFVKGVKEYLNEEYKKLFEKFTVENYPDFTILIDGLLSINEFILDKYFKNIDMIGEQYLIYHRWIERINKLDDNYVCKDGFKIKIGNLIDDNIINLLELLFKYRSKDEYNELHRMIKVEFLNMSEGQEKFVDLLSKIKNGINSIYTSDLNNVENIILLIDEPDRSFHPEWSRRFIDLLIKIINEIKLEKRLLKSKFQIILTTHSPFIVSDLPKENILILDNKNSNKYNELGSTFGSNIHMLLSNNFFMDSTIGEFAKTKIIECISFMDRYNKDQVNEDEINCIDIKKNEISYIISQIGEPVIKNRLEKLFKETFPIEKNEKELKIKKLEDEIIKLKGIIKSSKVDDIDGII